MTHGKFTPAPAVLAVLLLCLPVWAQPAQTYQARDTLKVDATNRALAWEPSDFQVTVDGDTVTFPSARPSGVAAQDRVVMHWYRAHPPGSTPAPAVVLLHSLHPQMVIANMLGRGLARRGIHAFVLAAPGYGPRRTEDMPSPGVQAVLRGEQAVADGRRARDAVAALPGVDAQHIGLQGTSLGGFLAVGVGGMDGAYRPVVLLLAGADPLDVIQHGEKDAANLRRALAASGYQGDKLGRLMHRIDDRALAQRLDPAHTWLVSARYDTIVAPANANALAQAIGLPASHHRWLEANHYSAMFALPRVLDLLVGVVRGDGG